MMQTRRSILLPFCSCVVILTSACGYRTFTKDSLEVSTSDVSIFYGKEVKQWFWSTLGYEDEGTVIEEEQVEIGGRIRQDPRYLMR